MKRPKRTDYPNGVYGDASYNQQLNKYCSYLENKLKEQQKKHIVDMMKDDEDLGLYDDTKSQEWGFENFIETEEDAKIFIDTLIKAPEPNEKLKTAFQNHNTVELFTITFWQNKQIKQQTISAPTFDTAYKKFRSEKPFVKILRIEE